MGSYAYVNPLAELVQRGIVSSLGCLEQALDDCGDEAVAEEDVSPAGVCPLCLGGGLIDACGLAEGEEALVGGHAHNGGARGDLLPVGYDLWRVVCGEVYELPDGACREPFKLADDSLVRLLLLWLELLEGRGLLHHQHARLNGDIVYGEDESALAHLYLRPAVVHVASAVLVLAQGEVVGERLAGDIEVVDALTPRGADGVDGPQERVGEDDVIALPVDGAVAIDDAPLVGERHGVARGEVVDRLALPRTHYPQHEGQQN